MTAVVLEPMRLRDLEAVAGLERALFPEDPWSKRTLASELAQPDSRYYVVARDGEDIIGYGGLAVFGDEAHIMTLGVRADRQRQGLGDTLLTTLLAEAAKRRVRHVLLEVAVDNEPAQRLYRRHGFAQIGVRKNYYQVTGTDAVVMRRDE